MGFESQWGMRDSSVLQIIQIGSEAHPILLGGYRASLLGVRRAGHDNHSPASSVKDKSEWSLTSTPVFLHGVDRDICSLLHLTQTGSSLPMSAEIEVLSRLLHPVQSTHLTVLHIFSVN
jgi:hypothetical protein